VSADRLPVHLSRSELHAVEAPASFEATGSFDVELVNHDTAVHVHLNLDEALSSVAQLDDVNHFVEGESRQLVRIQVYGDEELPVSGKLKIAAAHGSETRFVDVELTPPDFEPDPVTVDESLAEPPADAGGESESSSLGGLVANPQLVVLVFGVLAVVAAGATAVVVDNTLVVAGAVVVLVGFLVATYVLLRG
jgi:hypothetical protein